MPYRLLELVVYKPNDFGLGEPDLIEIYVKASDEERVEAQVQLNLPESHKLLCFNLKTPEHLESKKTYQPSFVESS